jgi:hypothetical protein
LEGVTVSGRAGRGCRPDDGGLWVDKSRIHAFM